MDFITLKDQIGRAIVEIGSSLASQAWVELQVHLATRTLLYAKAYGWEEAELRAREDFCMALRGSGPPATNWAVLYLWTCIKTADQDRLAKICQSAVEAEQEARRVSGRPGRYKAELYGQPAAIGFKGFASKFPALPEPDPEWDRIVEGWVHVGIDAGTLVGLGGDACKPSGPPEAPSAGKPPEAPSAGGAPLKTLRRGESHLRLVPGGKTA